MVDEKLQEKRVELGKVSLSDSLFSLDVSFIFLNCFVSLSLLLILVLICVLAYRYNMIDLIIGGIFFIYMVPSFFVSLFFHCKTKYEKIIFLNIFSSLALSRNQI